MAVRIESVTVSEAHTAPAIERTAIASLNIISRKHPGQQLGIVLVDHTPSNNYLDAHKMKEIMALEDRLNHQYPDQIIVSIPHLLSNRVCSVLSASVHCWGSSMKRIFEGSGVVVFHRPESVTNGFYLKREAAIAKKLQAKISREIELGNISEDRAIQIFTY
jgi:hypothetical protein